MSMNHEDLSKQINQRFDRLEDKIEEYAKLTTANETNLQWVKGYIKLSLSAMIALAAGVVTTLFKTFFKVE